MNANISLNILTEFPQPQFDWFIKDVISLRLDRQAGVSNVRLDYYSTCRVLPILSQSISYDVNVVVFKIVNKKGLDINHNNPTKIAKIMICLRIKNKWQLFCFNPV